MAISADTNVVQKEAGKKAKIQEFVYTDTMNVEYETYYYTGTYWSNRNSNRRFKEEFESHARNRSNRFTSKDSYTGNITHNLVSTAV